jgi:hypothetical protein
VILRRRDGYHIPTEIMPPSKIGWRALCLAGETPYSRREACDAEIDHSIRYGGQKIPRKAIEAISTFHHHTSLCRGASGWLSLSSYRSRVRSTSNKEKRLKCKQAECRPIKDPGSVVWPQSFPIAPCSTLPNAELGPAMLQKDCARIQAGRPSQQIKSQDMA